MKNEKTIQYGYDIGAIEHPRKISLDVGRKINQTDLLGTKHPDLLGEAFEVVWRELHPIAENMP